MMTNSTTCCLQLTRYRIYVQIHSYCCDQVDKIVFPHLYVPEPNNNLKYGVLFTLFTLHVSQCANILITYPYYYFVILSRGMAL